MDDGKLAEVFVESHDDTAVFRCVRQNRGVSRIPGPVGDVLYVVAFSHEDRLG